MSKWGRRRPYMAAGVTVNLLGLLLVWAAGNRLSLPLYFIGYLIVQIGSNMSTGAYNGIIPDIVPGDQRGEASGWMAAMSQIGTILGVVSAGLLMRAGHAGMALIVIAISLTLLLTITVSGARERRRTTAPEPRR